MRNALSTVLFLAFCLLVPSAAFTQNPVRYPAPALPNRAAAPHHITAPNNALAEASQMILDVRIEGIVQNTRADILKVIKTRPGRPYSETLLEEDKRALIQKTWFFDVVTKVDRTPSGYIVTFQCAERPIIRGIKMTGNKAHTKKALLEEANIKEGDALDPIAVRQAAERIKQFYKDSGYHLVHLEVIEGDQLGDQGVIFRISEGPKQRVLSVTFEGNQITTGAHLKTLIQSKPGYFLWINSEFTRKKLDDDVEILTNYYRKLGFFYAKIDRVFTETDGYTGLGKNRGWVKVKFIIDEGPRCKIRNIRFVGNKVFDQETLLQSMKIAKGKKQYYNQDVLEIDMNSIKEQYGNEGYVFAMPTPDPRVEQDYVDLVISIREGPRCYLETLDVEILGRDNAESYTKWHPVLNLSSLRPGDLLRTSEINATKRRLMASELFNRNPMQGAMPDFQFDYPKEALEAEAAAEEEAERIASGEPQFRGQSPEPLIKESLIKRLGNSFRPIVPGKITEPAIQYVPHDPIPLQTAPRLAPTVHDVIYRGQSGNRSDSSDTLSRVYTPPVYTPPADSSSISSMAPYQASAYQPVPYPSAPYPSNTQQFAPYQGSAYPNVPFTSTPARIESPAIGNTVYGSVAPTAAPLQQNLYPTATPYSQTPYTTAPYMPVQYRSDTMPADPTTATIPTATILANPYESINAASNIRFDPNAPTGASPYIYPIRGRILLQEAQTGSIMASLAVSSDAGLVGRFIYEELNFDLSNYPKGWRLSDWRNAYRGKGQRFRIEAVPGTEVQRYSASWETPYWLDLDYSLGVSGYYYQRYYNEWYENRTGGSVTFGKLWTQDISTRLSLGGQNVKIFRAMPHVYDESVVGSHPMYNIGLSAIYNTRDSEYLPTEGHYLSAGVEQVLGDYQFLRGNVDVRKYFMLRERPDRSGRWVLGLRSSLAVTEKGTPIFERYFGGGYTNLRGFELRGVSPRNDDGYITGGRFEFYNSAEMIFPLTADDMLRGSLFIDTGTVENSISKWEADYRVAVGFGLRISIPMMGPVPIALDFAFPISSQRGDDKQVFSFAITGMR